MKPTSRELIQASERAEKGQTMTKNSGLDKAQESTAFVDD